MYRVLRIPVYAMFLCIIACDRKVSIIVHSPPCDRVYSILQHNDSFYVSTLDKGIFRTCHHDPSIMHPVAALGGAPFRSFIFVDDRQILACSYERGAFWVRGDSMVSIPALPRVIWRVRRDPSDGSFWFATARGIFRSDSIGYHQFLKMPDAHDIAFLNRHIAVAHINGISLIDKQSGSIIKDLSMGRSWWVVETIDSQFVGGGKGFCYRIDPSTGKRASISLKNNYLWAVAKDTAGNLILGTQTGVFFVPKGSDKARLIGMKDICVKSVMVDKEGRIWAGRFWKMKYSLKKDINLDTPSALLAGGLRHTVCTILYAETPRRQLEY